MTDVTTRNGLERRLLFREVNERICELNAMFGSPPGTHELVCECHRNDCREYVDVPASEFERVRRLERTFVVVPGHESPDDVDVDRRDRRFSVVEASSPRALAQLSTARARRRPPAFGGAAA